MIRILCTNFIKARGGKIIPVQFKSRINDRNIISVDATSSTPVSLDQTSIPKLTPAKLLVIARPVKDILGLSGGVSRYCFLGA